MHFMENEQDEEDEYDNGETSKANHTIFVDDDEEGNLK